MQDARQMQALKMIKSYNNNIIISAAACCTKRITGNEMDRNRLWVSGCSFSAQRLSAYGERNADAPPWEITDTIQLFSAPLRIVNCRSLVIFKAATLLKKFVVSIVQHFFD